MTINEAQRDVRTAFLGGFAGQLVSSLIWFASASLATWYSVKAGILMLVAGGFFIFPLTLLVLRAMGRPGGLPKGHPMNTLGMQVAFTLPPNLLLVAAATMVHLNWFYPAVMIALGSHYFPFIFQYGMWEFGVLAGILIGAGYVIGTQVPAGFSLGGWVTALTLLVFAFVLRSGALRRAQLPSAAAT